MSLVRFQPVAKASYDSRKPFFLLNDIVDAGLATKHKVGKSNYYINQNLVELLINQAELYK